MQKIIIPLLSCLSFTAYASVHTEVTLANQYVQEKKYNQARTIYQNLIDMHPHNTTLRYNYAYLLKQLGCMHTASLHYAHVLAEEPEHGHAHIGYAQTLLALGDFSKGYQELEWRGLKPDPEMVKIKKVLATQYRLDKYIFLLRAEWGIGDTLHMLRYAKELKSRGATVHVALLHSSLGPLCRMQPYIDHIILPGDAIKPYHFAIPMISLPYVFGTLPKTIPTPDKYLTIDTPHTQRWRETMQSHTTTFNIGICWHGNTIHDSGKFMPLHFFEKYAKIPNLRLFSLQKRDGLEQIHSLKNPDTLYLFDDDFDNRYGAFIDTAALMKNLDLVITVDTSIAHLAGALGIPTWVILPKVADWRWMLDRTDSPWYSSIKLFRQKESDNWDMVSHEIKHALRNVYTTGNIHM